MQTSSFALYRTTFSIRVNYHVVNYHVVSHGLFATRDNEIVHESASFIKFHTFDPPLSASGMNHRYR